MKIAKAFLASKTTTKDLFLFVSVGSRLKLVTCIKLYSTLCIQTLYLIYFECNDSLLIDNIKVYVGLTSSNILYINYGLLFQVCPSPIVLRKYL